MKIEIYRNGEYMATSTRFSTCRAAVAAMAALAAKNQPIRVAGRHLSRPRANGDKVELRPGDQFTARRF